MPNLIEAQFKIQLRLADAKFEQATTLEAIQAQHAAFIQTFNTTNHWAHREREDGRKTPVAVLDGERGRFQEPDTLQRVFRHLQFPRTVNQHGCVSVQRFYIYAEQGLAKHRVAVWIYADRLNIEYQQNKLARYQCALDRQQKSLTAVSHPQFYQTPFASPQLEFFELDDEQWLKVRPRPPYTRRKSPVSFAKQIPLDLACVLWLFLL
jgi:hypothetical protein